MSLREFIHQHRCLSEVVDIHTISVSDTSLSGQIYSQMQMRAPSIMLCHNADWGSFSVVANLFATEDRLNRVLEHGGESLSYRLDQLPSCIGSWSDFCAYLRRDYGDIEFSEIESDATFTELDSLYALPQIRYWSGDSRAYFSLPTVFTRDFDSGEVNAGIYRLSPLDSKTLSVNWRIGSRAYNLWRVYADRGLKMPVTVAMGVDPALAFAAMFPLPDVGAELAFWGFLRGGVQNVHFNNDGLPAPADAEVVIEGYVDPDLLLEEGSFANHTGFYTESVPCPVIHVSSIWARRDAIIPITVVGPPSTENGLLGANIWELLFVYIRRELPCLIDLICPAETSHLPVLIVQVQAPETIAEWITRKRAIQRHLILQRAHTLILVDDTSDISSSKLIYWHCMNLERDSYIISDSGMRIVDAVLWRYQGRRKVLI
ncbi:MAG: UbiD family decarboxylase [Desulfuromonadaceae bacterium]